MSEADEQTIAPGTPAVPAEAPVAAQAAAAPEPPALPEPAAETEGAPHEAPAKPKRASSSRRTRKAPAAEPEPARERSAGKKAAAEQGEALAEDAGRASAPEAVRGRRHAAKEAAPSADGEAVSDAGQAPQVQDAASQGEPRSAEAVEAPAPEERKRPNRKRTRGKAKAEEPAAVSDVAEPSPASDAEGTARPPASVAEPAQPAAVEADAPSEQPVPEAPRPSKQGAPRDVASMGLDELMASLPRRRRGRPSKKDLEARKAIEAAKADPTPELVARARAAAEAILGGSGSKGARKRAPEDADGAAQQVAKPVESVRPQQEPSAAGQDAAEPASSAPAAEGGYGQRRRHHERRSEGQQGMAPADAQRAQRDGKDKNGQQSSAQGQAQGRRDRDQQRQRNDRNGERTNGGGNGQQGQGTYGQRQRNDRDRNGQGPYGNQNGQQGGKNNRRNNNRSQRDYVVEPKANREELEELKVGDLRAKAGEFGIDPAGLKKPELVDAVYSALVKQEGFFEFTGILDLTNEGFGFIRTRGYLGSEHDVYIGVNAVRANGLRRGDQVSGIAHAGRPNDKYPGVARIATVNGKTPEELRGRPRFGDLTPVFPSEPLRMEHGKDSILGRCIDLVAPIGKGQRGLIVSPPKAGKTTVLKKIAESIAANNPEVHLICLLVDERPEEVTDMQRSIRGEVVASTFDMPSDNHIAVSELVIERAKRLVEQGEDVVILLDSITRLARAYNLAQPASGRILSGGVDSTALYPPKRFLGAARNIENGGSLTILASALVDTGSKMDEVIFEEFKGTGNMELKLDRDLADRRIFPAIDPVASGTRKEELLLDPGIAPFVWGIRRILAGMNSNERAMSSLIRSLKATANNEEFLIRSAKKAQMQEMNGEL